MVWIVVVLAVLLGFYALATYLLARFSVRPIRLPAYVSAGMFGAPQESVNFTNQEGMSLFGWWTEHPHPSCIVILAHGYLMNRAEMAPYAYWLWQRGASAFAFDFRAHGRSQGNLSTIGPAEAADVAAAVAWCRERRPHVPIVLWGSSMGSAASALAGGANPDLADGYILDSAYSVLEHASKGWIDFLGVPKWLRPLLAPTRWLAAKMAKVNPKRVDVGESLQRIRRPVLLLHGQADRLAPPEEAVRNMSYLQDRGKIVWFPGANHAEFRWTQPAEYLAAVEAFLKDHAWIRTETNDATIASSKK
ncbi:MAG: alpha/beta hydrolase [Armatimonadetes bacterium]|nr:alpha/beta hydrolase [Armatimonadota bacterium]